MVRPRAQQTTAPKRHEVEADALLPLMEQAYLRVRRRLPRHRPHITWYPYVETKSTIRVRDGRLHVRLSDHLMDAPDPVIAGLLQILLCSLDNVSRKRADPLLVQAYEDYVRDERLEERRGESRRTRGRKHIDPIGEHRSLLASYLRVTIQMGLRLRDPPVLSWSKERSRNRFGHYDKDHGCIVVSRVLDSARVPRFVLDYVVYHELLHLVHPVEYGPGRRRVHTKPFLADEAKFRKRDEAEKWLGRLARRR